MKLKKYILSASVIVAVIAIVAVRLISNKQSFDKELKMVSESNTTVPVITDTVRSEQLPAGFSVNGGFSPIQETSIAAEVEGKITSVNSKEGDRVAAGQVLASIDNEIPASQLELAKFNLDKAEKDIKRFKELSQGDAATVQQYEAARQSFEMAKSAYTAAKTEDKNTFIEAPFGGIITKRYFDKGAYLSVGTPVYDIVEIDRVKFIARLTVDEAGKVQKGQTVKLSVDAYPEVTYDGKISAVTVKADLSKRYDVEIEVENRSEDIIKPGMYGVATFIRNTENQLLVIPRQAIAGSIKHPEVFLVKGNSVILRKIVITPFNDKYVVIKSGLKAGDVIVTSGQISLVNGSKIKLNN
ncbi:efflux RND transporter periplasmic adaptor subunit [uncultured Bacteroides sp.]|uniref:efflux RND transporter periplasmic adaptor subunit n=1 Tax=uncultured Bacteroides sp. TaxID=162156 RepID=UPI002AA6BAE1|nr:efflux RND transporter periplasmic adaptor subunit [uncultured Bacteroides sp.]